MNWTQWRASNFWHRNKLTWLLFCMVLDHLTRTRIFPGLKIMSPLAKCLSGEKPLHECGTRFDNRRNEKN